MEGTSRIKKLISTVWTEKVKDDGAEIYTIYAVDLEHLMERYAGEYTERFRTEAINAFYGLDGTESPIELRNILRRLPRPPHDTADSDPAFATRKPLIADLPEMPTGELFLFRPPMTRVTAAEFTAAEGIIWPEPMIEHYDLRAVDAARAACTGGEDDEEELEELLQNLEGDGEGGE